MNHLFSLLLIADSRIEAVHQAFNTRKTDWTLLLITLLVSAVLLGLLLGGIYIRRRQQSTRINHPQKLFAQLCRAHHLSRYQRNLLQHLAHLLGLPTPSVLLLDAGLWQLESLLRARKITTRQCEDLHVLQRTLYLQPRIA